MCLNKTPFQLRPDPLPAAFGRGTRLGGELGKGRNWKDSNAD